MATITHIELADAMTEPFADTTEMTSLLYRITQGDPEFGAVLKMSIESRKTLYKQRSDEWAKRYAALELRRKEELRIAYERGEKYCPTTELADMGKEVNDFFDSKYPETPESLKSHPYRG